MDTGTAEYFVTRDLEERQAEYRHWCETVRDPANISTEGIREIKSDNDSAVSPVRGCPASEWEMGSSNSLRIPMRKLFRNGSTLD